MIHFVHQLVVQANCAGLLFGAEQLVYSVFFFFYILHWKQLPSAIKQKKKQKKTPENNEKDEAVARQLHLYEGSINLNRSR